MNVTVNVNKLTLCHAGSSGVSTATMPDVCLTPPDGTAVPYDNISRSEDVVGGTATVFADGGKMIAVNGSNFSRSTGDEPGSGGGIISGVHLKESTWITYSFDVKMEGRNTCRLTDKKFQNHGNTVNAGGLVQTIIDFFMKTNWCGYEKSPAAGMGDQIPADESTWDDWVKSHFSDEQQPLNAVDHACMMHDLRIQRAGGSFLAGKPAVIWAHVQLALDFFTSAFAAGVPFMARVFALGAVPIFATMALLTGVRFLLETASPISLGDATKNQLLPPSEHHSGAIAAAIGLAAGIINNHAEMAGHVQLSMIH